MSNALLFQQSFEAAPVTLGPMASGMWRRNPARLLYSHARYHFVARRLVGKGRVAEIGAGDGSFSPIVAHAVGQLDLFDADPVWGLPVHDIVKAPLPRLYDAIYLLDVIEHIRPQDEPAAMRNIVDGLRSDGVLIVGAPTLESQRHASPVSQDGHVNCKDVAAFRKDLLGWFENVFVFGMNDATIHDDAALARYQIAVCVGEKG